MWTPFAFKRITRKDAAPAARTAARWSLFLMEFVVSGVSTTVVQTLLCDSFDGGDQYLRVQLTLECDSSRERHFFEGYAVFMMLVYPIGKCFFSPIVVMV